MSDPAAASARAVAELTNHPLMWTDRSRHAKPGLQYAIPRGGWTYSRPGPVTLPDDLRPRRHPRTIEVRVVVELDEPERQAYIAQAAELAREVERLRADLRIANEATLLLLTRCAEAERELAALRDQKTRLAERNAAWIDARRALDL